MDDYESDPVVLCWQVINEIRNRASAEEDGEQASARLAEVASFVPRWLFSTAVNIRLAADKPTPFGVSNRIAPNKRMDAWTQSTHRLHLAVKARSILGTGAAAGTATGAEDAIRNLSTILAQQAANIPAAPQSVRSVFDNFPPQTKQLILFAFEADPDGRVPTRPVETFVEILSLNNVAFVQNHMNHFLRHTKGLDAQIPSGLCVAIRTGSFTSGATDRPGAFSLFCCGPQAIETTGLGGRDANEQASSLMQMQLKTTDTTTGLSDKDIKSISKYSFTIPHDFFELARLLQNMAGVVELLFGFESLLAAMLSDWLSVFAGNVGRAVTFDCVPAYGGLCPPTTVTSSLAKRRVVRWSCLTASADGSLLSWK